MSRQTDRTISLPARAYRLLALVLFIRPLGNLSLAWGMRHFSSVLALNPFVYARALFNPYVALGVGALIFGLFTRMALLSLAELSVVLPLTASGYILSTLFGRLFLREEVTGYQWLGTILIFLGAIVVGYSSRETKASDCNLLPAEQ